jgi:hypothetical protein
MAITLTVAIAVLVLIGFWIKRRRDHRELENTASRQKLFMHCWIPGKMYFSMTFACRWIC